MTQAEKSACQRGVSEAVPCSTSQPLVELVSTEAGCFGEGNLHEPVARETTSPVLAQETASPELGSTPMEVEPRVGSVPPTQCEAARERMYAQVVSYQDTGVLAYTCRTYVSGCRPHKGHRSVGGTLCASDSSCLFKTYTSTSQQAPVVAVSVHEHPIR